ncbi:hypothetical protein EDD37DRAFT_613004 [Exophiala viscosa]|uniref:uncharacterized protein n=1 Tax=Exophiala viscosa TaxID=2486360 RepID=UPI0021A1534D|nr:hypothetical protein EDD37DRAFT_613004 [Exophiala viscosa]
MAPNFFALPLEIRLEIYGLVFGRGKAVVKVKNGDTSSCMLPHNSTFQIHAQRSSQFLRVNKSVLIEARPVLYANTTFHVLNHVFAGKLPTTITNGHPCALFIKQLIWEVDCDLLKHFYPEDLRLDPEDTTQWSSLELRCRADTWRNSFLGEWCDRESFVNGREQVLAYARVFQDAMSTHTASKVHLVEDRSQLGRGRVILRLSRHKPRLSQEVLFTPVDTILIFRYADLFQENIIG